VSTYLGDPAKDLRAALMSVPAVKNTSVLGLHGAQAALLVLLHKLGVVHTRRLSFSIVSTLISSPKFTPPPCSIQLAVTGLSLEYIQYCPKRMIKDEL
jgi:hypothetical protein